MDFPVAAQRWRGLLRPPGVWLMLLVAVVAGAVMAAPYVLLDVEAGRLEVDNGLHYALLVAHVFTATVALVLGPLQFIPAIRARRRWHRRIGGAYLLVGVLPAALAAVPVALLSGRIVTQIGLVIPAVGWLVTGWLAIRAIRRGDVEAHRAWMTRNYALTFLAVTARIVVPVMLLGLLATGAVARADASTTAAALIPIGQILGWMINLVVAEVLIRRRRGVIAGSARSLSSRSLSSNRGHCVPRNARTSGRGRSGAMISSTPPRRRPR